MGHGQTTRRGIFRNGSAALLSTTLLSSSAEISAAEGSSTTSQRQGRFTFGLNTSTLRGHELTLPEEIDLASRVGYTGLEPWISEIEKFKSGGGSLSDLKKRIADAGIRVESAIGFFDWIVDDEGRRAKALESVKREMDLVRQIGGTRIAAPPAGATDTTGMDLRRIAERYRRLLEIGDSIGVVPQVEIWGFSKTLGRLSEAAYVAIEAGHPKACILPDVYHLYRGGSNFSGIPLLAPGAIHVFHVNDYPAQPPREKLNDADRVFPGDGVAPYASLITDLRKGGFDVMLSLELFNREYWKREPRAVLEEGLRKMKAITRA